MTVRQLIERLKAFDPEVTVVMEDGTGRVEIKLS